MKKLRGRIATQLRDRVADFLDDHYPDACWAELVMWAEGYVSTRDMFVGGRWKHQDCKLVRAGLEPAPTGAYCGKCERTGRLPLGV